MDSEPDDVLVEATSVLEFTGAVRFIPEGDGGILDEIYNSQGWAGFQAGDEITVSGATSNANNSGFDVVQVSGDYLVLYSGGAVHAESDANVTVQLSPYGFAAGDSIVVSGASDSANDGTFTVQAVSGFTLILTACDALTPESQAGVTVGDGVIGQASAAIPLSEVSLFSAKTANGNIYLEPGGDVDSTAVSVIAGGANGDGNVSVTSEATFLTIENITATGEAAVAMNSGSLFEYTASGSTTSGSTYVNGLVNAAALAVGEPVSGPASQSATRSPPSIRAAKSPFRRLPRPPPPGPSALHSRPYWARPSP